MKRALLVNGMTKGECSRKGDKAVEMQFQIIEMSEGVTFHNGFITGEHYSEFRFDHTLRAQVAHPQHQGRSPIQCSDDNWFAEQNSGGRPGKADKDQTSH